MPAHTKRQMKDQSANLVSCGALAPIFAIMLAGSVAAQGRVHSTDQRTVAFEEHHSAIWVPRPGNINNAIVGEGVIPEELLSTYLDLHSGLQFAAAADVAQQLIAICPDRPEGYYNLACSLAQMRRHREAFEAMEQAIDRGWRYLRHTWLDPDLETLRDDPAFAELMMKMARLEHRERIMPRPLRTGDWKATRDELQERIPELLEQYDVPGVTVALVHDGAFVWSDAFGLSNLHQNVPMVVHDLFQLNAPVDLLALLASHQQAQHGLDLAETLAQADELELRDPPQRLARGTVPRYVDVDRELRARLLAHDEEMGPSAAHDLRRRSEDRSLWPISQVIPRTLDWMAQAIEIVAQQAFYSYCNRHILRPAGMQETLFALPAGRRERDRQQNNADNAGDVAMAASASQLVVGHTRFGTPLTPVDRPLRTQIAPIRTTAADLARMMAAIMQSSHRPVAGSIDAFATQARTNGVEQTNGAVSDTQMHGERPPAVLDGPLEQMLRSSRLQQIGLGLEVHMDQTVAGTRLQVVENTDGIGMLMRWYPDAGTGIVVLFNSESGPDAAIRIAHEALGGE